MIGTVLIVAENVAVVVIVVIHEQVAGVSVVVEVVGEMPIMGSIRRSARYFTAASWYSLSVKENLPAIVVWRVKG